MVELLMIIIIIFITGSVWGASLGLQGLDMGAQREEDDGEQDACWQIHFLGLTMKGGIGRYKITRFF